MNGTVYLLLALSCVVLARVSMSCFICFPLSAKPPDAKEAPAKAAKAAKTLEDPVYAGSHSPTQ